MKKISLVLGIFLASALSSQAFVDNQYMTTEQYLVNTGYSAEMSRIMAITNQDPYREPYKEGKSINELARRLYWYIVPGQNADLDFYNHSGSFNGWSYKDY